MGQGYRDLVAWQKAMELVTGIYRATQTFPAEERYGLVSQMRRAAVSIPSNIAEGHGRQSPGEFRQFVGHARGSLSELETQIEIAAKLTLLSPPTAEQLLMQASEVGRILNGLLTSLRP
jgi:four helix bundle protein